MALKTAREKAIEATKDLAVAQKLSPIAIPYDEMAETVVISRMALEGLAARAGVSVSWKRGEPWFTEKDNALVDPGLTPREREVEKRCRQLEQENTKLREEKRSVIARDDNVRDIIDRMQKEKMREALLKQEQAAKEDLRSRGASDADIAALEGLFGKSGVELHDTIAPKSQPGIGVPSMEAKQAFMQRGLNATGVTVDEAGKWPDTQAFFKRLDNEMQKVSGLGDLLTGKAPAMVTTADNGNRIEELIRAKLISMQRGYDMTGVDKT